MANTPIRRVLIADDDPDIRAMLTLNLELCGYAVTEAADGGQAGELARAVQPDLIVADVMMPVTDGFDLLEGLKADQATMDIPVVMLTARSSDTDLWRGWRSGVSYYITKPFDPDHLIQYIEHLEDPEGHPLPC